MADIIQIRRDTAANWTAANPILAQGEFGVETDTLKLKIGDGASPWTGLRYYHSGSPYEAGEGISINDFTINNTGIITIGTGGTNGTIKANGQDIAVKGLGSAAYVDTTTLPNKDLSNLTSTGKNISNWSSNVSNCVTNIPQDIKLELNNGVLRLKAGSKVYVPNGAGVFDVVNITADKTTTASANGVWIYFINESGNLQRWAVNDCFSGTTAPTSSHYQMWYDTTNNAIKSSEDYGTTWSGKFSFPIAIVTMSNGAISSIDQVFNGLGYIGSHNFRLPGLSGLAPNGRNSDGTFKNTKWTLTSVLVSQAANATGNFMLIGGNTGLRNQSVVTYFEQPTKPTVTAQFNAWYDTENNYIYYTNDTGATWVAQPTTVLGVEDTTSGKVSGLDTKQVFRAVGYSDTSFIGYQAMPSDKHTFLTLPTSGSTITALADGYLAISKATDAVGQYLVLYNSAKAMRVASYTPVSGYFVNCVLPVCKGDVVSVSYNAGGNTAFCAFVYANGAK